MKEEKGEENRKNMYRIDESDSILTRLSHPLKTTIFSSFKLLKTNPTIFFFITTLTILPLSLLLFASDLACRPLLAQISAKQDLARLAPTAFEARHVSDETRSDALTLVRLKALFFLPSYAFSLLAAITSVNSTALSLAGERPTLQTVVTSVRLTWKRLLVTSFFTSVITCAYRNFASVVLGYVVVARAGMVVVILEAILEMHLMAVLSVGMVVSVWEERFGLEALKVGWDVMEGRRFCGVIWGGFMVLGSGGIGWGFRVLMEGGNLMMMMGFVGKGVLIGLFCLVVLFSYVTNTVLYYECRKFHGMGKGGNTHTDVKLVDCTLL